MPSEILSFKMLHHSRTYLLPFSQKQQLLLHSTLNISVFTLTTFYCNHIQGRSEFSCFMRSAQCPESDYSPILSSFQCSFPYVINGSEISSINVLCYYINWVSVVLIRKSHENYSYSVWIIQSRFMIGLVMSLKTQGTFFWCYVLLLKMSPEAYQMSRGTFENL